MNIYSAEQIRAWDAYTIEHEPITSIKLMERAAQKCVDWLLENNTPTNSFKIFCGRGNNGGDGLAIARLLFQKNSTVEVFILESGKPGSDDFQYNLKRLHELPVPVHFIESVEHFPACKAGDIIIDALFGTGLNKPLEGFAIKLVQHINNTRAKVVSIDMPSGLFADQSSKGNGIIEANDTLTFQVYKKAFLVAENAAYIGNVHVLDIGSHPGFLQKETSNEQLTDVDYVKNNFQKRKDFAHKGTFGHALIIGGSYGKMGAAVLAVSACLRSGAGLVTAYIPGCGYNIMQTSAPEAMVITDINELMVTQAPRDLEKYSAIGIGPGMGTDKLTREAIISLLQSYKGAVVIDADGLNNLALEPAHLGSLPAGCILTPHPKEFERLFGACANDFQRIEKAQEQAQLLNVVIVLKGHHSVIALPGGRLFFNSTGNAGMAKGGSGDVLTGVITAFCAQSYSSEQAAILGVYIHGLAGDFAAKALGKEAMLASDIIGSLPESFLAVNK